MPEARSSPTWCRPRKIGLHSLSPWSSFARLRHSTGLISTGNVCALTARYRIGLTTALIDPVADDRGGRAEDFANYVTFVKELRSAAGRLGISLTLPSSYWYLKGFDVVNLEPYVDWFNFMSYDIYGTWDGNNA